MSTFLAVALVAGLGALSASPASAVITSAPQNVKVAFASTGNGSSANVTWDAPQVISDLGVDSYKIVLDGYTDAASTPPVYETSATEPVTGHAHEFTAVPPGVFLQAHVKAITTATVKKLRAALNVKRKGRSNYFGRSTRRHVVTYQKAHHKAATGRVNDKMRFALTV